MHFHLLFISNQCWEHRDELSGVNLTRFRSNDFRMTFSPTPLPQKNNNNNKTTQKHCFECAGSALRLLLVFFTLCFSPH